MSRSRRGALVWTLGIVLAVVALEMSLQAASFVVWRKTSKARSVTKSLSPSETKEGAPIVLCVGDSMTWGVGVRGSDENYPAQMQQLLDGECRPVAMHTRAFPGRNSSTVLQTLVTDLSEVRPDVVCILVGSNDWWNQEVVEDSSSGWRLRWRTGRLLHGLLATARNRRVSTEGSRLQVELETRRKELTETVERRGALVANLHKDYETLSRRTREARDPETMVLLLELLVAGRMHPWVLAESEFACRTFGERSEFLVGAARAHLRLGDAKGARNAAARAVELSPGDPAVHRVLATVLEAFEQPREAYRALAHALKIDGDLERFVRRRTFWNLEARISRPVREETLSEVGFSEREIVRILSQAPSVQDRVRRTDLERTLRAIVRTVRQFSAEPILVKYPSDEQARVENDTIEFVAMEEGVRLADTPKVFERATRMAPRERFFLADGHCTKEGYALIAEVVAREVCDALAWAHEAPPSLASARVRP